MTARLLQISEVERHEISPRPTWKLAARDAGCFREYTGFESNAIVILNISASSSDTAFRSVSKFAVSAGLVLRLVRSLPFRF